MTATVIPAYIGKKVSGGDAVLVHVDDKYKSDFLVTTALASSGRVVCISNISCHGVPIFPNSLPGVDILFYYI